MIAQLDMFAAGEVDTLPPWLDPQVCERICAEQARDSDHVGADSIGRVGNDALVIVISAEDKHGNKLNAWTYPATQEAAAYAWAESLQDQLAANRQRKLF